MGKPKAPAPPDPRETSAAATGTNIGTSIANTMMGNVNQIGPTGSLNYAQTGQHAFTDPFTGQTYDIPTFTAETRLSPGEQAIFDENQSARQSMARTATERGRFLEDYLRQPTPEADAGVRQRYEDALMERMQPMLDRDRAARETQLANQGIGMGSRAFSAAQDDMGRQANDARLAAILGAGDEQARDLSTRLAARSQPLNEITALLSGSQVNIPQFQQNRPQPIPFTDNAGLINQNFNQQMSNYNQRMQNWNSMWGGLFGLGAAGLKAF
jgi:hypothetical protein